MRLGWLVAVGADVIVHCSAPLAEECRVWLSLSLWPPLFVGFMFVELIHISLQVALGLAYQCFSCNTSAWFFNQPCQPTLNYSCIPAISVCTTGLHVRLLDQAASSLQQPQPAMLPAYIFDMNFSPLKVILKSLCTKSGGHKQPAFFFQCPDYQMPTPIALDRCCFTLHIIDLPLQGYVILSLWTWDTQDNHSVAWCQPSAFCGHKQSPDYQLPTSMALDRCCFTLHIIDLPLQGYVILSLWTWDTQDNHSVAWCQPSDFCGHKQSPAYQLPTSIALDRCCFTLHIIDLPLQGYVTLSLWAWETQDNQSVTWCQPSDFSLDFGIMLHTFIALNRCCLKLHKSMLLQGQLEMSLWLWEFKNKPVHLCYVTISGLVQSDTVFPADLRYVIYYCSLQTKSTLFYDQWANGPVLLYNH